MFFKPGSFGKSRAFSENADLFFKRLKLEKLKKVGVFSKMPDFFDKNPDFFD
jgi:hypothetical protein